jgi:protein-tyrosine sulfotransferase
MDPKDQTAAARGPDIFIGGPPRSGTTILQRVLCQSQCTNPMVGEAEHFFYLVRAYSAALTQFDSKTKFYFSKDELRDYHMDLADKYLQRFRGKFSNDPRLVLKAPWFTRDFPFLAELLPDALFVIIVRDPLDIVASQIEVGIKQAEIDGHNFYPRGDIQGIIDGIMSVYLPSLTSQKKFGSRLMTIRYEKLVSGDVALQRLTKFLDLPDLMSAGRENNSGLTDFKHDTDSAFFSELWDKKLTNASVGRHQDALTQAEIDVVKERTKQFRKQYGYE